MASNYLFTVRIIGQPESLYESIYIYLVFAMFKCFLNLNKEQLIKLPFKSKTPNFFHLSKIVQFKKFRTSAHRYRSIWFRSYRNNQFDVANKLNINLHSFPVLNQLPIQNATRLTAQLFLKDYLDVTNDLLLFYNEIVIFL